jgi:hypothetical protein
MRTAIQLSPRNESYQLRLAQTYKTSKKWDEATTVLGRLKLSQNPQISSAAKKELDELPFLKKFGVPPQDEASHRESITANTQKRDVVDEDTDEEKSEAKPATVEPPIDKRPVKFMKASLVSVDCSRPPVAVVMVAAGNKTLKLRAADYKTVAVLGRGGFSCEWKDVAVSINYKSGGKMDGDLVSIEVR